MKRKQIFKGVSALLIGCVSFMWTQAAHGQQRDAFKWWDPSKAGFPVLEGQGWPGEVPSFYDRLPARAEKVVRAPVWHLSQQGAGLVIRFRSNAPEIRVRYTVSEKQALPHMPATGVSGVDLYALSRDGVWQWDGGNWIFGDTISYRFTSLPHSYVKEYRLYLPLYNHVKWLEIGVPDSSDLSPLGLRPDLPIVVYGTSIAQGACASRPGMAWTAILGRRLHDPVINLAFSGNGRLEAPVVSLLTELDAKLYVVDCLPNMSGFPDDTVGARLVETVKTLRARRPGVPVLVVEHADATIGSLDTRRVKIFDRVNEVADSAFRKMKEAGMEDIYMLRAKDIGLDIESTVAGVHPNDYGMERYAAAYEKKIREILHEPTGPATTQQPVMQYRDRSYDWESRHKQELALNKKQPPRIVFLGNSITHFWGGAPKGPLQRGEDSWQRYFAPLGVRNFGYGWDRVENVLWRVYHGELDGYTAKQVVINIGTNNIGFNTDAEIVDGLRTLVAAVRQRQPAASILLLGVYPRRNLEQRVAALNDRIVDLAAEVNVHYLDPGRDMLQDDGKINPKYFVSDGLHPSQAGYQVLARAIRPALVQK